MKTATKIVLLVIILNVVFTAAVLLDFWHTKEEPTTLIVSWFTFTTGEIWALASIKKRKIKNGGDKK